jgi:hypothetical protein
MTSVEGDLGDAKFETGNYAFLRQMSRFLNGSQQAVKRPARYKTQHPQSARCSGDVSPTRARSCALELPGEPE